MAYKLSVLPGHQYQALTEPDLEANGGDDTTKQSSHPQPTRSDGPQHPWSRPYVVLVTFSFALGVVVSCFAFAGIGWIHFAGGPSERQTSALSYVTSLANTTYPAEVPFTLHYRGEVEINSRPPIQSPLCPIDVVYSQSEEIAEAVVYNSDAFDAISLEDRQEMKRSRPWQKTVIWGAESAPNRPGLEAYFDNIHDGKNDLYDAEMTYRLNSSVPGTYAYSYMNFSTPPVPWKQKRQDKIAVAFISNCHPKNARSLIFDQLLELLPGQIDSFGSCKNNGNAEDALAELGHLDEAGENPSWWNLKITTISYYKFTLAIENSNDIDYVTEKFYQPLERGSVPISFGAPMLANRFFPARNAALDLAPYLSSNLTNLSRTSSEPAEKLEPWDIAGLTRFVTRLKFLASEEGREEYEDMLKWKLNEKWKEESPMGKVVQVGEGYDRDCRLAGYLRGKDWAKPKWKPPNE